MYMNKFKFGDIVECIDTDFNGILKLNKEYTVIDTAGAYVRVVDITLHDSILKTKYYFFTRFKLVSKTNVNHNEYCF